MDGLEPAPALGASQVALSVVAALVLGGALGVATSPSPHARGPTVSRDAVTERADESRRALGASDQLREGPDVAEEILQRAIDLDPELNVLRVAYLCSLGGEMAPCGCFSPMLGGVDRASTLIQRLTSEGVQSRSPTLPLCIGTTFAGLNEAVERAAADDAADSQRARRALVIATSLRRSGVSVWVPGPADLTLASRTIEDAVRVGRVTPVLTNAPESFTALFRPEALVELNGRSVRVRGFVFDEDLVPSDRDAPLARGTGEDVDADVWDIDVVVVGDFGVEARQRLQETDFADVVILQSYSADATAEIAGEISQGGGSTVVAARSPRGTHIEVLDIARRTAVAPTQADDLLLDYEVMRRGSVTTVASDRLGAWFSERLETRLRSGSLCMSSRLRVSESVSRDPGVRSAIDAYGEWLIEAFREASDATAAHAATDVPYVGASACASCHDAQYSAWRNGPHARAMASLEATSRQFDYQCFPCHATGLLEPSMRRRGLELLPALREVQCESCHGPGRQHAADATAVTIHMPSEATCRECHDVSHSRDFGFQTYSSRVACRVAVAPGSPGETE